MSNSLATVAASGQHPQMEPEFAFDDLFDEDYLYFYERQGAISDERTDRDTEVVETLLALESGSAVLDLACGHGRIANRLARKGYRVTGLDRSALFLDVARRQASEWGVDVEYVEGDMREIPWESRFDAIVSWFTAFGYFDDDGNKAVLAGTRRALRPGGRLVMDLNNYAWLLRAYQPYGVVERDGDLMIDIREHDLVNGRILTERVIVRGGKVRRFPFFVRAFTFPELRGWLLDAGFSSAEASSAVGGRDYSSGPDPGAGGPLSMDRNRMLVVATARLSSRVDGPTGGRGTARTRDRQ